MTRKKLYTQQSSSIHKRGLFAADFIAKDTPIIQYFGNKITQKQADKRVATDENACIYLFELNDKYVLDGDIAKNPAKYINHSCNPNCYSTIIDDEVWVYSLRDIQLGEELSYDYGFQRMGWQDHPCRCGAKACFGFIVAARHRAAICKTKRYQKLINSVD